MRALRPAPSRALLALSLAAALLTGCASSGASSSAATPAALDPAALDAALHAQLFDGGPVDLGAALDAGTPLALVFWQSWCAPCIAESPKVQAAHEALGGRLRIVGVVSGPDDAVDEEALRARIAQLGLTYEQVRDRDLALTHLFGVTGTPTILVLAADGTLVFEGHREPESWDAFL